MQLVNKSPNSLTGEDFKPSQLGTGNDAYTLTRKLYQHVDANGYYASYPNYTLPAKRSVIIYLPVQPGYATGGYVVHPVVFNAISNDVTLVSASYWNVTDGGAIEAVIRGNGVVLDAGTRWVACVMRNDSQIVTNSNNPPTNKYYYGTLALYVDLPDTGLQTLIDNQTEELGAQTQNQTDTLMDTTGSDTLLDGPVQQVNDMYENLDTVRLIGEVGNQLKESVNTTEEDGTVTFPGLSLMGFTIQSQVVDVWDYLPDLKEETRWATTLVFVILFIHHMFGLIDQIFGLQYYGDGYADWGEHELQKRPSGNPDYSIDPDLGF